MRCDKPVGAADDSTSTSAQPCLFVLPRRRLVVLYIFSIGLIGSKYIHEVLPQESKCKVYSEGM